MRRWRSTVLPLTLMFVLAIPSVTLSQDIASDTLLTVGHYLELESVTDPQLSPDGDQVVYARRWLNTVEDKRESALWIMSADGSKNRFLVKGSGARWSPNGTRIAYLAKGEPEGEQIFVRWIDAQGASSQVTRVDQAPSHIRWSPDGTSIAFMMLVRAEEKEEWTIELPKAPSHAEWTEKPRIVERMHYKRDFVGFLADGYTHLFVVSADGGTPRQLTDGEWNVGNRTYGIPFGGGFDWMPDGRTIVFEGQMAEDWDLRYRDANIYAVEVSSRETRQLTAIKGPWTNPVASPDGRYIAFTGYEWTQQSYKASELYIIRPDGSGIEKISGDLERDPEDLNWAPNSSGVYFTSDDQGTQNVHFASLDGEVRQVTEGVHMLSLSSVAANNSAVGVRTSYYQPTDVVSIDLRRPQRITQLTAVNNDLLADKRLGDVEEIWYNSADGTRVQGWIVKPPSFDPSHQYPLILQIHGGPHSNYNVSFSYSYQNYAANGFVVLYTNPRGSTGYGTEFGNAIDKAYPSVDYDDLMAGVDAVTGRGYINTDRLYVTGCSGGGVLSSWVIGHTDRFAAAAVRCPVTNWISFAGTTDIAIWGYHRFGGHFWDDPSEWLDHSPLMHVGKVTTPTLLMTGELDLRTPMAQTEEYYEALKLLGVPTAMIRFNGEFHGTGSKPSNFMRTQLYIMNWFNRYGSEGPVATREDEDKS